MNILYHLSTGATLDLIFNTSGICTVASILPDVILIPNEIKLIIKNIPFKENEVNKFIVKAYYLSHSLLILLPLLFVSKYIFISILIHQIQDWFTHTGIFSTRPFYPISNYKIKFGKNILK